jgi:LysR family transcriptional regulator, low CO2-responsive transcriptional regulator
MNYTLHQLQLFLKIVQTKSITVAANELHLTQPAVSIQLKNLQEQFDIPLTEVIGRKLYITEFGYEIAEAATKILNEVQQINFKTAKFKNQVFGTLKVSSVSTGKYIIPYFLSDFIKANKNVDLILDVTNKGLVVEALKNNQIDFALMSVIPEQMQLNSELLMENKLYLVGSKYFEIKKKIYDLDIFENTSIIFREEGSGTRHVVEKFWLNRKIKVVKKMELTSNETVKQAVIAGLGIAIMPLIGIKNELMNGDLKIIPVKHFPLCSQWSVFWQKDKMFSPVAAAYLNSIKTNKELIMQNHFDWVNQY